jgi:hypothetical protein
MFAILGGSFLFSKPGVYAGDSSLPAGDVSCVGSLLFPHMFCVLDLLREMQACLCKLFPPLFHHVGVTTNT